MEFHTKFHRNKRSCCVDGCFNNSRDNPDLPFHTFPSNEKNREEWRIKCNKSQEFVLQKNSSNAVVCGQHFKKEDYFKKRTSSGKIYRFMKKVEFLFCQFHNFSSRLFRQLGIYPPTSFQCCSITFFLI